MLESPSLTLYRSRSGSESAGVLFSPSTTLSPKPGTIEAEHLFTSTCFHRLRWCGSGLSESGWTCCRRDQRSAYFLRRSVSSLLDKLYLQVLPPTEFNKQGARPLHLRSEEVGYQPAAYRSGCSKCGPYVSSINWETASSHLRTLANG
jgi:hypothetical protein